MNITFRQGEKSQIAKNASSLKGTFEGVGNAFRGEDCATMLSRKYLLHERGYFNFHYRFMELDEEDTKAGIVRKLISRVRKTEG